MAVGWKCENYILKGAQVVMLVQLLQVATFNHEGVCLAKLEAA